ncbi:sulfatase-like hydrolase/transferase [Pseudodesulfovibrio sp. JC047]|uniref:sulfatase-like hydrolase/transferase n=1 Tax=Pseudodesulfovibrio sp. JC047 TaxID=2683199 RepID=UPI0013D7DCA8|nr:sulfatase-like hydrolase/transferase [Pseudodesulfovibrio sp. JC047]NDV18384.1 sulfatase-like hydrolase/transferase [Pseudodesulfovibrio sp. JC047]
MAWLKKILNRLNFAGFVGTWLLFISLDVFNGLLLYGVTFRGFALADTFRAVLIDALLAVPAVFLSRRAYKWFTVPAFVALMVASLCNTFHILTYQSGISTYAIFSMIETTGPESSEFFVDQVSLLKVMGVLFSCVIPVLLFLRVIKREVLFGKKGVIVIGTILLVVSGFVAKTAVEQGKRFLGSHPGYMVVWSLDRYVKESRRAAHEKVVPVGIFGTLETDDSPLTCVIVVGESANRNHMGIYGYARDTTPYAEKDDWLVFDDVTSPATHTIPSLKQVLRLGALEQNDFQPSIIDLFNACGFKTFWLSNQTAPKGSGNILETMTARASARHYINLSRKEGKSATYDGELLPHLEKALADPAPKKAVFLHLLGSHLTYALRYPRERMIFAPDSREGVALKEWADDEAIEHINHYDNSLAYTDFVLHRVVEAVKNVPDTSFVLYFSDHGQDVYDSRYMRGCSEKNPTKNMVEVPMLFWMSPAYRESHANIATALEGIIHRPYSTCSLSGTIAKLARIRSEKLDGLHTLLSKEGDTARVIHGHSYKDMVR